MNTDIIKAIQNLNVIEFYYESKLRVVEPHCYGETTAGNEGLRAYQIDGYSSTGKFGWKMYDLGKADDITGGYSKSGHIFFRKVATSFAPKCPLHFA